MRPSNIVASTLVAGIASGLTLNRFWLSRIRSAFFPTSMKRRRCARLLAAPLEHDLEVTGTIEATLHAASSAVDTDFIINLIDVHPDGFTQYITQGLVRASYREGLGARKLIEPGRVYEYRLSFRPTSICFLKGHRIRIEVTSSDMDRHARNQNVADAPGTTANVAIAQQTIHHSGLMCSRLDLPVIPAA